MTRDGKIIFEGTVFKVGNSLATTIPPEMIRSLELKEGDTINKMLDKNKYGLFGAFWNPKQQRKVTR